MPDSVRSTPPEIVEQLRSRKNKPPICHRPTRSTTNRRHLLGNLRHLIINRMFASNRRPIYALEGVKSAGPTETSGTKHFIFCHPDRRRGRPPLHVNSHTQQAYCNQYKGHRRRHRRGWMGTSSSTRMRQSWGHTGPPQHL